MTSAVVIGGGVSGLVAAWRLALLGRAVEVFEATDDFGEFNIQIQHCFLEAWQ